MSQMANPNLAMLMQALQQQGQSAPDVPLSQDPTAEARARGGGRTISDTPRTTMTHSQAGHGSQMAGPIREAAGTSNDSGVTPGTPDEDDSTQKIPGGTVGPDAGTVQGQKVPWNVDVQRGTGPEAQTTSYGFGAGGGAPTETVQPSPAQVLAQQNAVQMASIQHPNQTPRHDADRDAKVADAIGGQIMQYHKAIADFSKNLGNEGKQPPHELTDGLANLQAKYDTLTNRMIDGTAYSTPDVAGGGAAPQAQPTQQQQAPQQQQQANPLQAPQPGMKLDAKAHPDIIKQFLQQSGGDKNKARQLAQQAGWSL